MTWKRSKGHSITDKTLDLSQRAAEDSATVESATSLMSTIQLEKDCNTQIQDNSENDCSSINEERELSLADIAELVQNNLPVPGIVNIEVEPTNTDPTPSTMSRKAKPWDVKKSSDSNEKLSEAEKIPTVDNELQISDKL